jgi:hypothetical protein
VFIDPFARMAELERQFSSIMEKHGIPYCIVGGHAVYLHVDPLDVNHARCTPDLDVAIERADWERAKSAAEASGFQVAEDGALRETNQRTNHPAVHFLFVRERVRPEHLEPVPDFPAPVWTSDGIPIAPLADLVRMKLTSYRLKDKVHVQDLDSVGLITPEIEATLSEPLRTRLTEVRATE